MSIASTLNSLCIANCNGDNERQPSFYNQCYLSPNYNSDGVQVEYLRNIILNESEKLYEQKIEELKNQTICEAAVNPNDKRQSIKALPLLGFAGS